MNVTDLQHLSAHRDVTSANLISKARDVIPLKNLLSSGITIEFWGANYLTVYLASWLEHFTYLI